MTMKLCLVVGYGVFLIFEKSLCVRRKHENHAPIDWKIFIDARCSLNRAFFEFFLKISLLCKL